MMWPVNTDIYIHLLDYHKFWAYIFTMFHSGLRKILDTRKFWHIFKRGRSIDIWHFTNSGHFKDQSFYVNGRYWKRFWFLWTLIFNQCAKRFSIWKNVVRWIEILLKNQESCIINGGITTKCFRWEGGTRQRDPISAYLFILVFEVVFAVIKSNQNIDKLRIFDYDFLHTAYASDITF